MACIDACMRGLHMPQLPPLSRWLQHCTPLDIHSSPFHTSDAMHDNVMHQKLTFLSPSQMSIPSRRPSWPCSVQVLLQHPGAL